ncbi:hypothetical protein P691DRAFT_762912 [Macrolepiota fuliginosa MF-IS2]|uniref:Uncharacterized protein n=1 Tax=Macrolepiota fuliginosa MF-IS2 TaxID=1400762 RepID=A0A9P6C0W1_9AGAR|nr:hypothetical protein P691DRAFT_777889 [Macrolepiota fuliginosa MF-IS2]KAF9444986.1 hypothetical protein P691DRAFT_762912 [Macrolepiota fuliginosa MF-IS2]
MPAGRKHPMSSPTQTSARLSGVWLPASSQVQRDEGLECKVCGDYTFSTPRLFLHHIPLIDSTASVPPLQRRNYPAATPPGAGRTHSPLSNPLNTVHTPKVLPCCWAEKKNSAGFGGEKVGSGGDSWVGPLKRRRAHVCSHGFLGDRDLVNTSTLIEEGGDWDRRNLLKVTTAFT